MESNMGESYRTKKRSDRIVMTDEARVLKLLRQEAKLSMRKAGNAVGVSDTYIAHLEHGRIDVPTDNKLNRLLKVYRVRKGTFDERVRNYSLVQQPQDQLQELILRMREGEIKTLLAVAQSIIT
jgi:transcriptional regulator with XRE-family HTH domain